jgi:calcium signal-modulating cyclophilin ligand
MQIDERSAFNDLLAIPEPVLDNGIFEDVYPDPDMERDVYEAPNHLAAFNPDQQDIFELLKTMQGTNQPFMPTGPQSPAAPPTPETPTSRFIRSKYPIVILALVVYMLFAFDLEFLVGGAVFSSLIVWEILEFFLTTFVIKQPVQQGGLVNILFMFGGISTEQTQIILKVLGLFNKIIRDIAIFCFTFVMLHLSWSFLVLGESVTQILDKDFSNLLKNDEL